MGFLAPVISFAAANPITTGAIVGGVTGAARGGGIKGAIRGAALGALGSGVTSALSGGAGGFADSFTKGSAGGAAAASAGGGLLGEAAGVLENADVGEIFSGGFTDSLDSLAPAIGGFTETGFPGTSGPPATAAPQLSYVTESLTPVSRATGIPNSVVRGSAGVSGGFVDAFGTGNSFLDWLERQGIDPRLLSGGISTLQQLQYANALKQYARQAADIADPFRRERPIYQGELRRLQTDPNYITQRPGYQFRYNEGLRALNRLMAKKGMLNSGNRMIEVMRYGQGLASTEYGNEYKRLAELAGARLGGASAAGQLYGNLSMKSGANRMNAPGQIFYGLGRASKRRIGLGR